MCGNSKKLFVASSVEEKGAKREFRVLTSTIPSAAILEEVEMDSKGQQRDTNELPVSEGSPIFLTRESRIGSA